MSLFYSNRDVRIINTLNTKKRKKDTHDSGGITIQEMYSCNWCDDEYDSETELHVHKKVKHVQDLVEILSEDTTCKICITQHSDEEELTKHVKTDHLLSSEDAEHVHRELFICDICNLIYFNKGMLAIHMQQLHDPEHKFAISGICPKCNKEIQIKHVWFHFQRHSIQSVACCPICLKKCKNRRHLQEHLKLHPHYYNCTICGYETKIKDNFTIHMQSHNSNLDLSGNIAIDESLLWRCFTPRKQIKSQRGVYSIGMKGLKLNGLFICVLCRGLCREEEKAAHIARYHLVNIVTAKKQYFCVCGEQFFNNVLLKHHVFKMQGDHRAYDTSLSVLQTH